MIEINAAFYLRLKKGNFLLEIVLFEACRNSIFNKQVIIFIKNDQNLPTNLILAYVNKIQALEKIYRF